MPQWKSPTKKYNSDDTEGTVTEIRLTDKESSNSNINNNRLYFYGNINDETALGWNKQLDDTSRNMKMMQVMYDLATPPPIYVYIQSNGGEIFASLSILGRFESIKSQGIEIYTIVDGFCASGATIISVGGSTRYIRKYSCMMIHQLSGGCWGTFSEMKDEQQNLDLLMEIIKDVYKERTLFTDQELQNILTHDLYLSSDECINLGLVDKII